MTVHSFLRSIPDGDFGESLFRTWAIYKGYRVTDHASLQKIGVDIVLAKDGLLWWCECKTDKQTAKTGNVFIETISVDTHNKKGWIVTSKADTLIYFMPDLNGYNIAVWASMETIRRQVERWSKLFRTVCVDNVTASGSFYYTKGILVPLDEFLAYCSGVISL